MRSLWAGVSGLQAHQVAMDVEGNNISNVNTTGFKYSRTNFADMLSQTSKIATAPQDPLGGKTGLQVGLGTSVSTVTHVFSQGSRQTTDVKTDVAIEGDGFFVVSPDGGRTTQYTRAGDFSFDAYGNFVNHSGLIVQGWNKDANDRIDSTMPVRSIQIDPGMTIPAKATQTVALDANLNSGLHTKYTSPIYALDNTSTTVSNPALPNSATNQKSEDFGVLFDGTAITNSANSQANAFNLQEGHGVWMSFQKASVTTGGAVDHDSTAASSFTVTINGVTKSVSVAAGTSDSIALQAYLTAFQGTSVNAALNASGNIVYTNANNTPGDTNKNILVSHSGFGNFTNLADITVGTPGATTAYKYQYTTGAANPATNSTSIGVNKSFHTTEDMRAYMQWQLQASAPGAKVSVTSEGKYEITNNSAVDLQTATTGIGNGTTIITSEPFINVFKFGDIGTTAIKSGGIVTAAVHGSSTDVYDSLGSKHTLTFTFRKESTNTWSWSATIPTPGDIGGTAPTQNVFQGGAITFGTNGSLISVSPQNLAVSWNNGSAPGQNINVDFGSSGTSNGMTSNDNESQTQFIGQDGYASGILQDKTINQNGYIIGSFSNGKSLALAQISVAKFANNLGLMSEGGNLFSQSANSGDPTIGAPGSGGRGAVFSQALEMSNVDLSRSLTDLIVIQRGYQANSKTITTSDQMLQVLLQIKQ